MRRRQKIEALVFSRRHSGEADRLVTFFTREQGLVTAVAKGVRKIPSQRGGHLEPLTKVLAVLHESRAGIFVEGAETQEYFSELRVQGSAFQSASNMALVVTRFFGQFDSQPDLYDLIERSWQLLPSLTVPKQYLAEAMVLVKSLELAGLLPDLSACRRCGVSKPREAVVLDAGENGWRCLLCHPGFQGTKFSLAPRLLRAVQFIALQPRDSLRLALTVEESEQVIQAMRRFVADIAEQSIPERSYSS